MKYAEASRWIRRFLRDPAGNIWSDDLIRATFNQVQDELQSYCGLLVEVRAMPVPPRSDWAYLFEWENAYLPAGALRTQALRNQGNYWAYCSNFEVQTAFVSNSTDDPNDIGTATTQPWEAWIATPQEPPTWQLPDDYHEMKMADYDERPIFATTRKDVNRTDPGYKQREGEPQAWYMRDEVTRQLTVYPKPSTTVWADETGSGMVTSVEDDTESSEIGAVTRIEGRYTSSSLGITVDVIAATDQMLFVYEVVPREIQSEDDELVWPATMLRYVCYRVVSRLYGMNSDGRIPTLAAFWEERYQLGLRVLKSWVANRRRDRLPIFSTHKKSIGRRKRMPRLPDKYPATYP